MFEYQSSIFCYFCVWQISSPMPDVPVIITPYPKSLYIFMWSSSSAKAIAKSVCAYMLLFINWKNTLIQRKACVFIFYRAFNLFQNDLSIPGCPTYFLIREVCANSAWLIWLCCNQSVFLATLQLWRAKSFNFFSKNSYFVCS